MRFSLIMGTVDRLVEVERFLESLQCQDHRDFELLIIDQNGDERLKSLVGKLAGELDVRRLRSPRGLSRARNLGLAHARGDVIAFPDDDCWYPDGLLSYLAQRFVSCPALDGITGRFVDDEGRSEGRWLAQSERLTPFTVWRGAISFSIFLRSSLVQRIGRFDEALGVGAGTPWGAGEETDYLLRGLRAGGRIEYDRALVLRHPVKTASFDRAACERQGRYEAGFGRVIRRGGFPGWYFPLVCLRTLAGATLALCRGRPAQARFKWHGLRSRIEGWRAGTDGSS